MITFPTYDTIDLFAGPGGWDLAARRLGLRVMGIEHDRAAHLTRRAAGFHTIRDGVENWGPRNFPNAIGLIGSPPCPTFSAAGKGSGRRELDAVLNGIRRLGSGLEPDHQWHDERTGLTLEPMRWVVEGVRSGRPFRWVALEQVPTVLPVWEAMADELRQMGYGVATGNLQAEQYGVPQTRKRAVLIARLDGPADLPEPTHSRFHTRDRARLDPGVLPWVSMAQALGWEASAMVRSNYGTGGDPAARGERVATEPSATVTGKVDRNVVLRQSAMANATDWVHERPATTVVGSFSPDTIAAPGYRVTVTDGSRQNAPGSVRVSVQEAAVLQSFPADFPWQGSRTKQYQQVGNAIPPLLAEAVLRQSTR